MPDYEVTRAVPAAPERVFAVAADPGRSSRWVPKAPGADVATASDLKVDQAARRVEWTAGATGLSGVLEVRPEASGGSDVVLRASLTQVEGDGDDRVPAELADALLRLANEVDGAAG